MKGQGVHKQVNGVKGLRIPAPNELVFIFSKRVWVGGGVSVLFITLKIIKTIFGLLSSGRDFQ